MSGDSSSWFSVDHGAALYAVLALAADLLHQVWTKMSTKPAYGKMMCFAMFWHECDSKNRGCP